MNDVMGIIGGDMMVFIKAEGQAFADMYMSIKDRMIFGHFETKAPDSYYDIHGAFIRKVLLYMDKRVADIYTGWKP